MNFWCNLLTQVITVKEGTEIAVVFATDQMISKIKEIGVMHFDATFKVVPRLFYQLATIFIWVKGHAIPALHTLMTAKKRTTLYSSQCSTAN